MDDVRRVLSVIGVVLGLALFAGLIYQLAPVLLPFLIAMALAYLGYPIVDLGVRYKIPRTLSVTFVFLIMLMLALMVLTLLLPAIENQLANFAQVIPQFLDRLHAVLGPWLMETFGLQPSDVDFSHTKGLVLSYLPQAKSIMQALWHTLLDSGMAAFHILFNIGLILVVTFYLLRDWHTVLANLHSFLPLKYTQKVTKMCQASDEVIAAFMRGQLSLMLSLAVFYSIGLTLLGISFSLVLGLFAGILSIVPYLGAISGVGFSIIVAFLQYHEIQHVFWVILLFGVGQLLESLVLTPVFLGERLGLHPVAVIFAILAGGQLFGFVGVLLALPVAAVLLVLVHEVMKK